MHGHDKPLLLHAKLKKAAKILPQLPNTSIHQPQLVTNIPNRRGFGRAGFRRKVPCTNPLLKPKVYSQLSQIQR